MKTFYLIAACALLPVVSHADSLFPVSTVAQPGSSIGASLYADSTARQVGDILTILIDESATASSQAATQTSKTETANVSPGVGPSVHIGGLQLGLGSIPAISEGDGTTSNASGTTTRADSLNGEITVTVTQVLPNGNLEVEGTREVGMNAETESITLTGIVRPEDVSSANTVESSQIANAQIKYGGKGTVSEKQHDGLITRVFKFLF